MSSAGAHSMRTIIKRNGVEAPFDESKIHVAIHKAMLATGDHDSAANAALTSATVARLEALYGGRSAPSVEEIQDIVEQVLIKADLPEVAKAYILYRHERARIRRGIGSRTGPYGAVPYRTLWETLLWNVEHACFTLEEVNEWVRGGRFGELVGAAEEAYHEQIESAAEEILRRRDEVRLAIVAGPSSSGKTTTTLKIGERLRAAGMELVVMGLDNYFFDLEKHPRDDFGDYDYETPEALDLNLINEHLVALLAGETVVPPRYDFLTGRRMPGERELRLAPHEVLVIDTLHGLYDRLTEGVPAATKFKLYIETLSQQKDGEGRFVRWTDLRLLRRMVRDAQFRNHPPLDTVGHWHYVRRSELKHIIPFLGTVDFVFNGALPYELPVLKSFAYEPLCRVLAELENQPAREDALIRARRVRDMLDQVETLADTDLVPGNSLMREFIGGSALDYE